MSGQGQAPPAEDQAAKLMRIIGVVMDERLNKHAEANQLQLQGVQVQLGQIELQLRTLTKLVEEGGVAAKSKPRTKKTADAPAAPETPTPATGGDAAAAPAPAPAAAADSEDSKFSPNAYHWFTKEFKNNAAFRAEYLTAAALELMKNDANVNKKKTDAEKCAPQAKFLWNHYKVNDKVTYDAIVAKFDAAKKAHDEANKPVAQQKEPNSPAN